MIKLFYKLALRWVAWKSKRIADQKPEFTNPVDRAVQYEPGDFAAINQRLIDTLESIRAWETLWVNECSESLNPQRSQEAADIAKVARLMREQAKAFYQRWDLSF